jgi:hypothetical protein
MNSTFRRDGNTGEAPQQALPDFASTPAGVLVVFISPQVPAYFLSMRNGLLVWNLVVSLSIGFIVSAAANGREMVTAISLGLSLGFWGTVLFLGWSASHLYVLLLPILMTFAASILIVLAGGTVRQIRVASARRATPSMRRPVDVKARFFFLLSFSLFPFS